MTKPRNRRGLGIGFTAVSALILGTIGLAAAPAQAIGGCSITNNGAASSAGTVGVPQMLDTNACVGPLYASYQGGGSDQINLTNTGVLGQAVWFPSRTGNATVTDNNGGGSYSSNVAKTSTQSTVDAPNTAQVGVATTITVTVQSTSPGHYQPTGTVTVVDANGATITTMGLTPRGTGTSYAYWRWTAPAVGNFVFKAIYSGDSYATASTSPQDLLIATPSGGTISLNAPSTATAGNTLTLRASVYPYGVQGSVGFTLNGAPISASVPLVNGLATYNWTPTQAGNFTLGANYTTNQGGSGSTTQPISIASGPTQVDYITLTQVGATAWQPNNTYTLGAGSYQFTATALSGAQVRVGESGPCSWNGYTLTVPSGGACNLTAATSGGNGYAPTSQGYIVKAGLGQQTAALAAPLSGKVNYKKIIKLERPDQGTTNANQNVLWNVAKKSKSACALVFPSDGSVNLKFKARGYCTVTASAPGVDGQWAPFVLQRTYQGA
jgi:hypothetical protein